MYSNSGAVVTRRSTNLQKSHTYIGKKRIDILMVIMASGIATGCVRTTTMTAMTETESCKMAAILQQPNRWTETCSLGLWCTSLILGSLGTRVFETRKVTRSELFSLLTCPHSTIFTLLSIFSSLEMSSIKI